MREELVRIQNLLTLLVKAALMNDDQASLGYRQQAAKLQRSLAADPSLVKAKLDGVWTLAVKEAEAPELIDQEGRVSLTLPADCPISAEALFSTDFDVDRIVNEIAASAATG